MLNSSLAHDDYEDLDDSYGEEVDLRKNLSGLTLEEAVRYLIPYGWNVIVHRYDDDEYENDEVTKKTVSLDIQDGKICDCLVYDFKN